MAVDDPFLSLLDAAELLNISARSIRRKLEDGDLTAHKFGALVRIRRSEVDAYIERSRRDDAAPVEQAPEPIRRKPRPRTHGAPA
jgi:excisionase family DNA binding protein